MFNRLRTGSGQGSVPALLAVTLILGGLLSGCGLLPPANDTPPEKVGGSVVEITAAPDAGGPLSFRNCPTLAEAAAAVPTLIAGPEANGVPFKDMVLQCNYSMNEPTVQGRPAGIGILVFDASTDGVHLWDSARTDPNFPNPTNIAGLADVAFATGTPGHNDVWVVQGGYGFHMSHTRPGGVPLDQLVALARAMLVSLGRAPR